MNYEGDWLMELRVDDFPRQYQDLVQIIGVSATVKLADHFGGLQFYVPKIDTLLGNKRNSMIREDRKRGLDYRQLAQKYKLTEVWIRQIVDHQGDDSKQMDMFS